MSSSWACNSGMAPNGNKSTKNTRKGITCPCCEMVLPNLFLCIVLLPIFYVDACQPPLKPIYNSTQHLYISCNAWEPDCPPGTFCQMATMDWKNRLHIYSDFTLFLCCADETLYKDEKKGIIIPMNDHFEPPSTTPPPSGPLPPPEPLPASHPHPHPQQPQPPPFSPPAPQQQPLRPSPDSQTQKSQGSLPLTKQQPYPQPPPPDVRPDLPTHILQPPPQPSLSSPPPPPLDGSHPLSSPHVIASGPQGALLAPAPRIPPPQVQLPPPQIPLAQVHVPPPFTQPPPPPPPLQPPPPPPPPFDKKTPSAGNSHLLGKDTVHSPDVTPHDDHVIMTQKVKDDLHGNNLGSGPRTSSPQLPGRSSSNSKNPILPPQAQIMLPGNGNRVIEGPQVIQLIVGEINQNGPDGMYKYSGSISLVQDSGLNILVDSGSGQNRNQLLAALAQQGIKPQNIQIVVYTHAHPDHIGNDNLFPYAQKLYSTTLYKGDEYMPLENMQEPSLRLTQNVEIWQTPGHTYQHNSVIVRNVPNEGNVAISGDLFMNENDMNDPSIWEPVSVDKELQSQTRNLILCQVDFIIPGHGGPFKVTQQHKSTAQCIPKADRRKRTGVGRNRRNRRN